MKTVRLKSRQSGAGAANQAIKSVAIARGYLAPSGIDAICIPAFGTVTINDEEKTGDQIDRRGKIEENALRQKYEGTLFCCRFYGIVGEFVGKRLIFITGNGYNWYIALVRL